MQSIRDDKVPYSMWVYELTFDLVASLQIEACSKEVKVDVSFW
jgi:hypothetical protein